MKNVASTSVLRWGGGVLCLWEGGEPYELHPRMLETLGLGPFDILGLGAGGAAPDGDAAAHRERALRYRGRTQGRRKKGEKNMGPELAV